MGWTAQYVLENEAGERYDLTAPGAIFMVNVEGLGVATGDKFGDIGNGFFSVISSKDPQNRITGDLVYREGAYTNYRNLVNWIHQSKTLYFCYAPIDTEYRRRVCLKTLQKSRRDGAGYMTATVSFDSLSPWYLETPTKIDITPLSENAKIYADDGNGNYGYDYDANLQYGGDSAGDMSAEILGVGHIPAAFVLRYTGELTNPEIRLVGASGTVYGICKITGTTGATDTLELSTLYGDSHVWKIASGGAVTDLLGSVNLAFEIYPHAPTDESSFLSITSDTTMTGSAELFVSAYYRSV